MGAARSADRHEALQAAAAARVEFIVAAPPASVQLAQLMTLGIDTGPIGDNDPQRLWRASSWWMSSMARWCMAPAPTTAETMAA